MKRNISMSAKEVDRITVMDNLLTKRVKQRHAAAQLGLSVRQIQRLVRRYREQGASGLIHKNRGRVSNRAINGQEKDRVIELVRKHYVDFGPTFAHEKLVAHHGVTFGIDTLRKEMITSGLWVPKKRKQEVIHLYRNRRACVGELIQLDGSPHAWFENRAPSCTLVAFIDDATSNIMDGEFVDYEGTWTLFEAGEHYLLTHGKPLAFYVDKHSTFKINRQATVEEELKDTQAQSQFARAMDNLDIEVIFANSPETKGRVERLFETLQDRLVKELRLAGISTKKEATRFLREVYIPSHNVRFSVAPKDPANLHRPLSPADDLSRIFTIQSKRLVSKVLTVQYKNTRYQLVPEGGYRYTLKNAPVLVEEHRDGTVVFRYHDTIIPATVQLSMVHNHPKPQVVSSKEFSEGKVRIPSLNHPWRRVFYATQVQKLDSVMTQDG